MRQSAHICTTRSVWQVWWSTRWSSGGPRFKSGRPDSVANGLTSSCGVGPFCDILEARRECGNYSVRFGAARGDERLLGGVRDEWRSEWSADAIARSSGQLRPR